MYTKIHTGEILLVDPKRRSAKVQVEQTGQIIVVPLSPGSRDDDLNLGTREHLPKEGTRVIIGCDARNNYTLLGMAPTTTFEGRYDEMLVQRRVTGTNPGNPGHLGVTTDDLGPTEGFPLEGSSTFGGSDPIYKKLTDESYSYAGNSTGDLMPGDHLLTTKDGNAIGVLEGGVALFRASELCQILGIRYNDLLRFVSRNFEHFTDFGTISVKNASGTTSYVIEGAASFGDALSKKYGLRIDLGGTGNMMKFTVLNGAGGEVSAFHMESSGNFVFRTKGWAQYVVGAFLKVIHGVEKVFAKGRDAKYDGEYITTVEGSETRNVNDNRVTYVNKSETINIGKDLVETIGGGVIQTITGAPLTKGYEQIITVGSHSQTINLLGSFNRTILGAGDMTDWTSVGDYSRTTIRGNMSDTNSFGNWSTLTFTGNTTLQNLSLTPLFGITLLTGVTKLDGSYLEVACASGGITAHEIAGARIKLKLGKVAIGNAYTGVELLMLIDMILQQLDLTEVAIATHIHATAVGPTAPPANASTFMGIKTALVGIRTSLNTIRGTLL
jgi:hypothetical protein